MRRYVFHLAILSLAALVPSLQAATDQEIAQQIIQKLQAEKQAGTLKKFSIDLQVDEGTVWLSGRVASEDQQFKALDLARRVKGVKQVVNDLTVGPVLAKSPGSKPESVPAQSANTPPQPALPTQAPPLPPSIEAVPIHVQPVSIAKSEPQPELPAAQAAPALVASPAAPERAPTSFANSPMLNSVSKALVSAVGGGRTIDEQPSSSELNAQPQSAGNRLQSMSGSQVVQAASPIGSGVDTFAPRHPVVQAAPPIANAQPIASAAPQMAMMPMQMPYAMPVYAGPSAYGPQPSAYGPQVPLAMGPARTVQYVGGPASAGAGGAPMPMMMAGSGVGIAPARYDHPQMPGYAWPSYAAHPNYAAVTYPKQYSPTAWPYIGPFYPYPQVPLGWRKVTLEWDDGWWMLDFKDRRTMYNH